LKALRAAILAGLGVAAFAAPAAGATPGLRVVLSKNVELFSVLALLAPGDGGTGSPGLARLDPRFPPHRDHPAVTMTRTLLRHRSPASLMRLALRLSDLPEARTLDPSIPPFSRLLLRYAVPDIRDFYEASAFEDYWRERRPALRRWGDRAEEALARVSVIATLEGFFGTPKAEYRMVFAPLLDRLRTGDLRSVEGGQQATVIFGPREGLADGEVPLERGLVVNVALLEFGRLWIADILDRNPSVARRHASLRGRAARLRDHPGPAKPWRSFWIDNITAAVQARLAAKVYGSSLGPEILERFHGDDFLAAEIYAVFDAYEADRVRYPTFESFLNELMIRLESRLGGNPAEKHP
jgi:hypothetical protein